MCAFSGKADTQGERIGEQKESEVKKDQAEKDFDQGDTGLGKKEIEEPASGIESNTYYSVYNRCCRQCAAMTSKHSYYCKD